MNGMKWFILFTDYLITLPFYYLGIISCSIALAFRTGWNDYKHILFKWKIDVEKETARRNQK